MSKGRTVQLHSTQYPRLSWTRSQGFSYGSLATTAEGTYGAKLRLCNMLRTSRAGNYQEVRMTDGNSLDPSCLLDQIFGIVINERDAIP